MSYKFKFIHSPIIIPANEWLESLNDTHTNYYPRNAWQDYKTASLFCAIRSWRLFYENRSGIPIDETALRHELSIISKLLEKHFHDNPQLSTTPPREFAEMSKAWDVLWKNHVNRKSDSKPAEKLKKQPLPKLKIVKKSLSEVLGGD